MTAQVTHLIPGLKETKNLPGVIAANRQQAEATAAIRRPRTDGGPGRSSDQSHRMASGQT